MQKRFLAMASKIISGCWFWLLLVQILLFRTRNFVRKNCVESLMSKLQQWRQLMFSDFLPWANKRVTCCETKRTHLHFKPRNSYTCKHLTKMCTFIHRYEFDHQVADVVVTIQNLRSRRKQQHIATNSVNWQRVRFCQEAWLYTKSISKS